MSDSVLLKCSQQLAQAVVQGVWALFVLFHKGFFYKTLNCHSEKSALVTGASTFSVWPSACVCEQGMQLGWGHFPPDLSLEPSDKIINANTSSGSQPLQLILLTVLLSFAVGSE